MQTHPTTHAGPRYARARTLAARLDVHVSTLWRWVELGRLPAPHRLGPGVSAWDLDEVDSYLRRGAGMRLTRRAVERLAREVLEDARRRSFAPPAAAADEESNLCYYHLDLRALDVASLRHELSDACAALRALPRVATSARGWWCARYDAIVRELRSRRAA